jgi:hypothetical protein
MYDLTTAPSAKATSSQTAGGSDALQDPLSDPLASAQLDTGAPAPSAVAAEGLSGSGGELPFRNAIQDSFGKHDVSSIRAHTGAQAQGANSEMGSKGFAMGGSVGLSSGADLHTVAHEAAHAVSQNSGKGVSLYGGPDSPAERHADAVADRVVAGQSAEGLLDAAPSGGGSGPQLAVETWDKEQETWTDSADANPDAMFARVKAPENQEEFDAGIAAGDLSVKGIAQTPFSKIAAVDPKGPVPRKVLKETLGESWSVAKSALATADPPTGAAKTPSAVIQAKKSMRGMMTKIWEYRQWHHDVILQRTKSEVGADKLRDWSAAGSTTLTSDIDVNLKGDGTEEAVGAFNRLFKADGWGKEAGVVYDVNVYAMDFMHGKGLERGDHREVNREGARLGLEEGGIEDTEQAALDQANQEGWAMAKMRIYMTGAEWKSYREELMASCPQDKKSALLAQFMDANMKYNAYRKTMTKEMGKGVGHTLTQAKATTTSGYDQIQQQAKSAAGIDGDSEEVAIASSNRIYERKLSTLTTERGKLETLVSTYHSLVDSDGVALKGAYSGAVTELKGQIDALLVSIRELVSECALYSNEAYITDGAVNHTVVGLQMGKNIQQSKGDTMNAINENMADVLKEIGRHGHTVGEAAFKSGKYMWRMADAAKNAGFNDVDGVRGLYESGYEIANTIKGGSGSDDSKHRLSAQAVRDALGQRSADGLKSKVRGIGIALMKKYNEDVRGGQESAPASVVTKAKH